MRTIELKILDPRLGNEFPLPVPATSGSAGVDLRACLQQPLVLEPGDTELIATGMSIHLRDPGYAAMILCQGGSAPLRLAANRYSCCLSRSVTSRRGL